MVAQGQKHDIASYDHIIMSYHGLPERHVDKVYNDAGDLVDHCETVLDETNKFCYKATAFETSRLVAEKLGLNEDDYLWRSISPSKQMAAV